MNIIEKTRLELMHTNLKKLYLELDKKKNNESDKIKIEVKIKLKKESIQEYKKSIGL